VIEKNTMKGVDAMERTNAGGQKAMFRMLLESYLEKWDDPTCRPRIGM
jgi:hypothetical protein